MRQIAFKFFAGGVAGLLAWVVTEPTAPPYLINGVENPAWGLFEIRLITMLGLLVGLVIGGINGYLKGSRTFTIQGVVLGGIFGACGAFIGYFTGAILARIIFGDFTEQVGVNTIPGRTLFGTGLGAGIGLGIGASGLTVRRTIQGLIGGALGGVGGGALFDPLSIMLSGLTTSAGSEEVGQPGRALLCLLIGAGVGLLIGVVEQVGRVAWVRLHLGRNEGKEWVLDVQTAHIGRDERANIPLFGDPSVAPLHCSIVRQGDAYWLYDAGTPTGTFINGQRVMQAPLLPGAVIQVGSFPLEFQLRAGSAPARAAERLRGQPMVMPQIQQPVAPLGSVPVAPVTPKLAALVGTQGPAVGLRAELSGTVEMGREGAQIQVADAQASRKHARVVIAPSGPMVEDLGSTNGTFVNGNRISSQVLRPGDEIRIGQSVFRYEP